MPDTRSQRNGASDDYARYIGVGFTFVFIVVVPAAVGFFVDKTFGTLPLLLLIGLGLGFAAALYYVYREMNKLGGG
jgi:F0F1-type ATP synthase assembly protein I